MVNILLFFSSEGTTDSDADSDDDEDDEDAISKVKFSSVSLCLEALHRTLQRRDVHGLLSMPEGW